MNVTIVGSGYVGLVTGVTLAEIGHHVTCLDINQTKVNKLKMGISPIYEPGLESLMVKNIHKGHLRFTTDRSEAYSSCEIVMIAVGTPQRPDGSANLSFIETVGIDIANFIDKDIVVVTKSTVPVGTNHRLQRLIKQTMEVKYNVHIAANPEFLREGSAISDSFHGDRIVIGADNDYVSLLLEEMYSPLHIPVYKTDTKSAELIKYASNAFLATKISFINEISNICEKVGANIEEVANGMGMDRRIGSEFLKAGIGYGGSCFPKDTNALVQIAGDYNHKFDLLKSVIEVNNYQQELLVNKALERFGTLSSKKIALLGLSFKPNTDDMREAASIIVANKLIELGASISAYDPIAIENAKKVLPRTIDYRNSLEDALIEADAAFILTEWKEIKKIDLKMMVSKMRNPIIFDGRNCFSLDEVSLGNVEYHSIGRKVVKTTEAKKEVII